MKTVFAIIAFALVAFQASAENDDRYVEVVGTSEIEIVPDEIHYVITIKEYFEEEFDGKSKPENYRTKVGIDKIEKDLRTTLQKVGIDDSAVRTQEVGEYWRQQGKDFLISKQFDITLSDFSLINKIVSNIDTKGVNNMRIGELKNKDMQSYHEKGKIEALKAAKRKAAYLAKSLGCNIGKVLRIEESVPNNYVMAKTYNAVFESSGVGSSYDQFKNIKLNFSIVARFEITD